MRRFQKILPSVALACLASLTWAQNPASDPAPALPTPDAAAPEDIAAKAMAAMDALNAPADKTEKPDKNKASATSGKPDKSSSKKSKPAPPGAPASGASKTSSKSASADPASAVAADDDNDDTPAGPGIIPPPPEDGRGMDMMSRSRMDMMVPPGRSHRGVHYPMYRALEGDRGEIDPALGTVGGITAPLESLFESDIVTRLDNDHIQFDRAKWVQFEEAPNPDGTPKPSMSLEIERGVYDMKNDILMTNQPVRIENKQFLIEGDTMLHDRASGLTRLTGRVRMTFFNQDPESAPGDAAPSSPRPATSPDAPSGAAPAAAPAAPSKE